MTESLAPPPERERVPFEDTGRPFFGRLIETIKLAFVDPVKLFSGLPDGDIGLPVLYGAILGTIGGVFGSLWQLLFGWMGLFAEQAGAAEFAFHTGFVAFFMIFSPLFAIISLLIQSAIYHLMLLLVGDGQRGFPVTLRAVAYGSTPAILGIVPFCGGFAGVLWSIVLVILGACYGHDTDGWRAVVAYLLPLVVCCCLFFGFMTVVAFALGQGVT